VFAGAKFYNSQSIWYLTRPQGRNQNQQDKVLYGEDFYLKNKGTDNLFGLSYHYRSPKTGQSEGMQ
jgi:hypothetical protein